MTKITLTSGQFGWDYFIVADDGRDILIQTDWDYPSVAQSFGWRGKDDNIAGAQKFLDRIADNGKWVEDPGYFDEE